MSTQRGTDADWAAQEQLTRAAWYYYVESMTQDDIARQLNVSRASAGRLLDKARKSGIVSFTIDSDYLESFGVAQRLREAYSLSEVIVLPPAVDGLVSQRDTNRRVGLGGAQFLQNRLSAGSTVGLGWGDTVHQTMRALHSDLMSNVAISTLTGGVGAYINTLSLATGDMDVERKSSVLPTPLVASTDTLADALRQEQVVQDALESAKRVEYALLSVGGLAGQPTLVQMGYTGEEEMAQIAASGAVGDVLGIFYDADGNTVDVPLHRRRIGIDLEDLRAIPNVVGVAGGLDKLDALRGALRGGFFSVLVTTDDVAERLLDEAGQ